MTLFARTLEGVHRYAKSYFVICFINICFNYIIYFQQNHVAETRQNVSTFGYSDNAGSEQTEYKHTTQCQNANIFSHLNIYEHVKIYNNPQSDRYYNFQFPREHTVLTIHLAILQFMVPF